MGELMKKKVKFFILILFMLLIVASLFAFINPVRQSVVGSSSGDSYYDERCIDITQYGAPSRIDEHGCGIVSVCTRVTTITGLKYGSYSDSVARTKACSGLSVDIYRKADGSLYFDCFYNNCQDKGGFERVLNYCTYDPGDLLVEQTFFGAKTITKSDLRYPIKSFCRAHPSIVMSGLTSVTSSNIPQDLIDGKSVTINSGDKLVVYYVINNVYNLPNRCSSSLNQALSLEDNYSCSDTFGFTTLCDGVWDSKTGSCTVTKVGTCDGTLEVALDGSKICVVNYPIRIDCVDSSYIPDIALGYCYKIADSVDLCSAPYTLYSPSQLECTGTWELCPQCPIDKVCDQSLCKPKCSEGIKCTRVVNPEDVCSGEVVGQYCVFNDTKYRVCAIGESWDNVLSSCTTDTVKDVACDDGTIPTVKSGVNYCYGDISKYVACGSEGKYFSNGECYSADELSQTTIVNVASNNTIWYVIIGVLIFLIMVLLYVNRKKRR